MKNPQRKDNDVQLQQHVIHSGEKNNILDSSYLVVVSLKKRWYIPSASLPPQAPTMESPFNTQDNTTKG